MATTKKTAVTTMAQVERTALQALLLQRLANEFGVDTTQAQDLSGAALDAWLVQAEDELTARLMAECAVERTPVQAAPQVNAAPSEQAAMVCAAQCRALVLRGFDHLQDSYRRADEAGEWDDADCDVVLAADSARELVQRLGIADLCDFAAGWYRVLAVLVLANKAYSPGQTTIFGRILAGLVSQFQVLPELWHAVEEGLLAAPKGVGHGT